MRYRQQLLAWQRTDRAFFAAGACHILAWAFLETYPMAGFSPVGLRRVGRPCVGHAYVSAGTWAFDHGGWTRDDELLAVTRAAHAQQGSDAEIERLALTGGLDTFCAEHNSRLPSQYAFDPWPRVLDYLAGFDLPSGSKAQPAAEGTLAPRPRA